MTLTEQAIEKLREVILIGVLADGTSITERQISDLLSMSRTPVRAAMQALANEGLLEYESQRGYRVRTINLETIFDAFKVRSALEGLACQIVCETGLSNETATVLKSCIEEGRMLLEGAGEGFQHNEWRNMNELFHQTIVNAANNDTLSSSLAKVVMMPMLSFKVIATTLTSPNMTLLEGSQRDHEQILNSLQAGQSTRASNRMQEHILVAADLISKDARKQLLAVNKISSSI
ncbi:GntR family transcriptional regulator [Pseudocolwellia sp. HL-MZ19]|uniref:GntR family transcriptional regulator n=1 Tax=unclassified Pseudocolwellia TaxID=2848178 RepID=UPI003CE94FA2